MSVSLRNRFKCPECGSSMFGTSNCLDWDKAEGKCHGLKYNGERCYFSWHRKTEDEKVFTESGE